MEALFSILRLLHARQDRLEAALRQPGTERERAARKVRLRDNLAHIRQIADKIAETERQ